MIHLTILTPPSVKLPQPDGKKGFAPRLMEWFKQGKNTFVAY
jgi:hypothetical protein